jgi:ComF family protein
MKLISGFVKDVMNLFYPAVCEACGAELVGNEHFICIACWALLPKTNFHLHQDNPVEMRFFGRVKVARASSMYYFNKDTRVQTLLHGLKYKNKSEIGVELGKRFGNELCDCNWIKEVDRLIPIPLSKQKLKQRGYNQSERIAAGLSQSLHISVDTQSVVRSRNTKSQTTMTVAERIENVRDAFAITDKSVLENKHIVLLDDVLTTGATLESCAREVLKVTGARVSILTLACAIE